ncbi:MAG: hypothetical protein IPG06_15085 [Haliea sp.]|nr:hypothetical protein [Haliea sp.]
MSAAASVPVPTSATCRRIKPTFAWKTKLNGEYKPMLMEIFAAPKPWISAINGACAGIGNGFDVCDLR